MTSYRLDLSYDGSGFRGFARQRDVRTVQGELEAALSKMAGPVNTVVAGRTDAGVHAAHQVVSFSSNVSLDPARVVRSLNTMLSREIAIHSCTVVPDTFSARYSATWRSYEYRILNREVPDPFRRHTHWHLRHSLNVADMHRAASYLGGRHEFASFGRTAPGRTTERTVRSAEWRRDGDVVVFEITGRAFCHQMVRSIVDTCVEVGKGTVSAEAIPAILAARDRNAAPRGAAPPGGVTLVAVHYSDEPAATRTRPA